MLRLPVQVPIRAEVFMYRNAVGPRARHLVCLAFFAASACGPVPPPTGREATFQLSAALTEVSSFGSNPGALKMFKYVPAGVPPNAPLVLALHGCAQTAADYEKAGWNALADKHKFLLLYPEQTTANNGLR